MSEKVSKLSFSWRLTLKRLLQACTETTQPQGEDKDAHTRATDRHSSQLASDYGNMVVNVVSRSGRRR